MKRLDWKSLATLVAALTIASCSRTPQTAGESEAGDPVQPAALNPDNLPAPSENPVYPWSVVPGGVHSRQSVQRVINRDPIVKEHYRAVDVAKLRTEQLSKPKSAYVSYRRGDSIYWTRNPVLLKAGETVLTDGESTIRGRCGNMVSDTPQLPIAPALLEPPPAAMEIPVPASRLVAAIPPALSKEHIEPSHATMDRAPHVNTSVLPSAQPVDGIPGYAPQGALGGFVPVAGGSGGGAPASIGPPPESTAPNNLQPPLTPPAQQQQPPPPIPIVIAPMTPPRAPSGPPSFQPPPEWPTHWYPPTPDSPLPPPPVLYPPPEHPPVPPPPPNHPPGNPPPGNPPPGNPPPGHPPPGNPPPGHPPPGNPPPGNPPPGDPPHFPPPPSDPPFDPPPPEDPPGIPEPTAFVLIGLGMIGLGLHLSRQKP